MSSPSYRIVNQDENSIHIEYQTPCENCGALVDHIYTMILGRRENIVLYYDEGSYCEKCWLMSEASSFGFPSREVSRVFQNIEGTWFLTMILPDQKVRDELKAINDVEFVDNQLPFQLFQATSTDFIITGARLELRYFQQILSVKSIESHLQSKQVWLAEQKAHT